MLDLSFEPKWITFDCYGTLVQWHRALEKAVGQILAPRHIDQEREVRGIVDALRTRSMDQQQRSPFRDYNTILRASLGEALSERDLAPTSEDGETLLSELLAIPPHPEVPEALHRLRVKYRLAIISNTDDDLIAGTVAKLGVPVDAVITAQQAKAYKPDHRLFQHAHAAIGAKAEETVHVGMGQVTDLKVCSEMGIRAIWIDRLGETLNPDWAPQAILPDLSRLPELLAA